LDQGCGRDALSSDDRRSLPPPSKGIAVLAKSTNLKEQNTNKDRFMREM
jgi:hypothetical protein